MELTILNKTYPFEAPFVRVVKPRFVKYTQGFVTAGGSLCADILTPTGWSPCITIPTLMFQLKLLIKDAKIDSNEFNKIYTLEEARHHYNRTTKYHGWG